ncbi:MAG: thermonuclease family protein [Woeseiaceae bacterium]
MLFCSIREKASNWAPFVFLSFSFFTSSTLLAANCSPNTFEETVTVSYVYDGDTIKLSDGRKLRLIGVNTPERGRDGKADEPFYLAAKQHLEKIIELNNHQVKLITGKEKHDRYQRLLAHIFTKDNKNISEDIIRNGLGYMISIAPNLHFLSCYQQAEQQAKSQQRGFWNHSFSKSISITQLNKSINGFHVITGSVKRIGESRSAFWLNLKTPSNYKFALRIAKKNLDFFTRFQPSSLLGKNISARGWVYKVKNEQRINIHHPASLEILSTD